MYQAICLTLAVTLQELDNTEGHLLSEINNT